MRIRNVLGMDLKRVQDAVTELDRSLDGDARSTDDWDRMNAVARKLEHAAGILKHESNVWLSNDRDNHKVHMGD